jgi:hypothetical protein
MNRTSEQPAPVGVNTTRTPRYHAGTKPFWDATAEGRLSLQRRVNCGVVTWYPRAICPECQGTALDVFDSAGIGTIYSYTVNYRGSGAYRDCLPYILAYVELDEGPRFMTNIVGANPDAVSNCVPQRACDHAADGHQAAAGEAHLARMRAEHAARGPADLRAQPAAMGCSGCGNRGQRAAPHAVRAQLSTAQMGVGRRYATPCA